MKKLIVCCCMMLMVHAIFCQSNKNIPPKQILIIHSYNDTQKWALDQNRGIFKSLIENNNELTIIDLDAKRKELDSTRIENFITIFNLMYQDDHFDLILITDNPALDFVNLAYPRLKFMKDVPMIANGINYFDSTSVCNLPMIKIITEEGAFVETVEQIIKFYPELKNVYLLTDFTRTGIAIRNNVKEDKENIKELQKKYPYLVFYDNKNVPLTDIIREINALESATAVVLRSFFYDSQHYYSQEELTYILSKECKYPVFCLADYSLKNNVIGGKLSSGYDQGCMLGREAEKYLTTGEWDDSELINGKTAWYFNYPALKEHNLLNIKLPKGSIVIDKPISFFQKYRQLFRYSIIALCILVVWIIIIIFFNVSLRKRVKQETSKVSGLILKLETFIAEMPIAYMEIDNRSIIKLWNKSSEQLFGYAQEEAIGTSYTNLIVAQSIQNKYVKDYKTLRQNYLKTKNITKEGKILDVEWYFTKYYDSIQKETYYMCMVIDITHREKLVNELEYMLDTNKKMVIGRDRFITSSMHDLKNMITPLLAYSELLMMPNLSSERVQTISEQINKNANILLEVFKGFSELGKIRSDIMECSFTNYNLFNSTTLAISFVESNASLKHIEIKNDIDPAIEVYADSEMINSVLMNLLTNAIKFTPNNGKITIDASILPNHYCEVRVKDSGIGMDTKQFEKLIKENKIFTTLGTNGEMGTGLGLLICNEMIEKNKGTFHAMLNEEKGTTMLFTVPLAKSKA